jgi:single-strand DNA-binding protein
MSLNLSNAVIAGNLTRDPEVRPVGSSTVASFTLAVNRKWKDASGEKKEAVSFIDCKAWGKTAEMVGQYLIKGRGACVVGRIEQESWDDKDSGQKRSKLVIVAETVQFTDAKPADASAPDTAATAERAQLKRESDAVRSGRPIVPGGSAPIDDGEPPFTRFDMPV